MERSCRDRLPVRISVAAFSERSFSGASLCLLRLLLPLPLLFLLNLLPIRIRNFFGLAVFGSHGNFGLKLKPPVPSSSCYESDSVHTLPPKVSQETACLATRHPYDRNGEAIPVLAALLTLGTGR